MLNKFKVPHFTCAILLFACGTNLYKSLDDRDSPAIRKERAIVALNSNNYEEASKQLSEIWKDDKSNEIASLYGISKLGESGFDVFCLIRQTLALKSGSDPNDGDTKCPYVDPSSQKTLTGNLSGNSILETISTLIPSTTSEASLSKIKEAIDILNAAKDKTAPNIKFQICLTSGIYASPILSKLESQTAQIQTTLASLPSRLNVTNATCGSSTQTIDTVGRDLNATIAAAGALSTRIAEVSNLVAQCLPDSGSGQGVNAVTKKATKLLAEADKGCAIPASGTIGSTLLPTCMTPYINSGAQTALAGDGIVSGCELTIHCSTGACLK